MVSISRSPFDQITVVDAILAATTASVLLYVLYMLCLDPLRNIPGPPLARFTSLWELVAVARGDFHKTITDLHDHYGPIIRIGPNRIDVATEQGVKAIYNQSAGFPKSRFYEPFGDSKEPHLMNTKDNDHHAVIRKKIAPLYSMTSLMRYEAAVDSQNEVLMRKMGQIEPEGRRCEMSRLMQQYAFDTVATITTGEPIGMLPAESDEDGIMNAIHVSMTYSGIMGIVPWLHQPFVRLTTVLRVPPPFIPVLRYVYKAVAKGRNRSSQEDRHDFLARMLENEKLGTASAKDTETAVGSNIVAGADNIGVTLSSILYQVYTNASVLQALRREIDERSSQNKLSDPVTWAEAQQMPYLQAVLKEGLRMHPAVGMQLTRAVPVGGASLSGYYLPQGTDVGVNAWALHRSAEIWGKDANEFRPERWFNAPISSKNHFSFGGGSRTCIGKNISLLDINKVLPQIVRRYDLVIESPPTISGTWFVQMKYSARVETRP